MSEDVTSEGPEALRKELERYRLVVSDLHQKIRGLEAELQITTAMAEMPGVIVTRPELQQTMSRLVSKIAMIVQAEKVLIFLYHGESGELALLPPALGVTEQQAAEISIKPSEGITGEVYRTGDSIIYNDPLNDPRVLPDIVSALRIRNGIAVPLVIKQRNEEERVVHERIIGVAHTCNKRYEQEFNQDDLRLLEMLAEQAAAVISNAQLYITLTEEKERLEDALESMRSGVIVVSAEGCIRLMNRAACLVLELPADGYEGKQFTDVIRDGQVLDLLTDTFNTLREQSTEIELAAEEEVYRAETSMVIGEDDQLTDVVTIFSDITDIRHVERMKTTFVSTVSHELRTPLTSIKGFISTLIDDTDSLYDDETRHEFYEIIDQECDRLTRLIGDLLNISRIESGRALEMEIVQVNLRDVAQRVLSAQQQYTSQHNLINQVPEDLSPIEADADKVSQILDNLIGNAIKYSPEGGDILVSAVDEGDSIRIDITDQGLGIPERHRDKIFDRFQMVEGDSQRKGIKGTGIGLYLVRHLAHAHGGEVGLTWSEVDEGSTFTVSLPKIPQMGTADDQ